jgi:CRISPR/Cas system-associated exonuclease Cas4 (RecB family)
MHRYATCPGSWLAEQSAGPDISDKTDANHGTRIHNALAGKLDPSTLTVEEYDTWERCKAQAEILTAEYITPDANGDTIKEERLWSVGEAFSGEPDLVVIGSRRALVIDYKTLLGDVAHAVGNLQLRTLAVLVWEKHDVDEVVVSIIQPLAGAPTVAVYTSADLEQAAAEIYGIVEQIRRPGNPRVPSGAACKYCRARTTCPEALAVAVAPPMDGIPAGTTPAAIAATMTAPTLGAFLERAQVADAVIEACREEAKRRIEAGETIPGWILKPGAEKDTITNPQAVADRFFALGGTQEAFIGAVKVTKSGLKEAASALTGAKGKTLHQIVEKLCDGAVETKQNQPSLARV